MEAADLKSIQAPLKQRYREQPEAAIITLRARGSLGDGISCSVETGRELARAGLHPATGGDGAALCSGDMLLEALVACAGVTLAAVASSLGFRIDDARLTAEGDIDFRGTLAVARDAPVGFKAIRLAFEIEGDLTDEQIATLIKLTERYCVVLQTIRSAPSVTVATRRGAAA
ncbi:MAG TPA: OsmC family protein [Bauldia sp.]|nr:OsmC family protein [Bauldia sp.]